MVHGEDLTWHIFLLLKKNKNGKTIEIFNHGNHYRDFTYIDDIISGILLTIFKKSKKKLSSF